MKPLKHDLAWVRPSAMWESGASPNLEKMQRPALLCFKNDNFMQELAARFERLPAPDIDGLEATPENFQERLPGADPPQPRALKLFQAVHGRHYLVATSLVCQLPGLPDHGVDKGQGERAGFVLRRLDGDGVTELAWRNVDDTSTSKKEWKAVSDPRFTLEREDILPAYPVLFPEGPRKRKILVGLVPTVSRETYENTDISPTIDVVDPRGFDVTARVWDPLKTLLLTPDTNGSHADLDRQGSLFLLLDLADFLKLQLPAFWDALVHDTRPTAQKAGLFWDALGSYHVEGGSSPSFRAALKTVMDEQALINDGSHGTLNCNLRSSGLSTGDVDNVLKKRLDDLLAENPLPPATLPPAGALPKLEKPALVGDDQPAKYVLRAVYRRPQCLPTHNELLSNPTEAFEIAPHFDFEAPARPIRISLPFDTSIAGLRKFKKSVGFVMSKQLRKQLCRSSTKFDEIIKGNLQSCDDVNFGEICSFSIPILTIVAMILMMIIVMLLNIVFWWLPFLKVCLPIRSSR
jgi:hypothetical protein